MKPGAESPTLLRRVLRLLAPRPTMCPDCGDAMAVVDAVSSTKGQCTTRLRCESETCGKERWA